MADLSGILYWFVTVGVPVIGAIVLFWIGVWVGCCWSRRRARKHARKRDAEMGRDMLNAEVESKSMTPYTLPGSDDMADVAETAPMLPPAPPTVPAPAHRSLTPMHRSSKDLRASKELWAAQKQAPAHHSLAPAHHSSKDLRASRELWASQQRQVSQELRASLEMPTPRATGQRQSNPSPLGAPPANVGPSPPPRGEHSPAPVPPGAATNDEVTRAINALAEALRQQSDRPETPTGPEERVVSYHETDAARFEPLPPLYQSEWRGSDDGSTRSVSRPSSEHERVAPLGPRLPRRDTKAGLRTSVGSVK